jgi:hypothetical protein
MSYESEAPGPGRRGPVDLADHRHAQLRLARGLLADIRLPWQQAKGFLDAVLVFAD